MHATNLRVQLNADLEILVETPTSGLVGAAFGLQQGETKVTATLNNGITISSQDVVRVWVPRGDLSELEVGVAEYDVVLRRSGQDVVVQFGSVVVVAGVATLD